MYECTDIVYQNFFHLSRRILTAILFAFFLDNQTQTLYDNTISIYFLLSYIFKILLCFGTNLKIYAFQNQSKKQDFRKKELLETPATEQEDDAY